jgi:hypothetical protein
MKRRNSRFGYQRIAQQISFGEPIDKDVARRVLLANYRPDHPAGIRPPVY